MSTNLPLSLLICGSLAPDPDIVNLARLRSSLINDPHLAELRDTVSELPDLWSLLVEREPSLKCVGAESWLQSLAEWIKHGDNTPTLSGPASHRSRNTQLAVWTVLTQIIDYTSYLNSRESVDELDENCDAHASCLQDVHDSGIQGLCIGLLSAIALACATDRTELSKLAATSVRLAMCVGGFIDLDEAESPESTVCLSARWSRGGEGENRPVNDRLKLVLESCPEAYLSVLMDDCSATITTRKGSAVSLMHHLRENGAVAKQIDHLHGRYHYSGHKDMFKRLADLCENLPLLNYPQNSYPLVPLRRNDTGEIVIRDQDPTPLHEMALQCILVEKADWHTTMRSSMAAVNTGTAFDSSGAEGKTRVMVLGPVDCIPRSTHGLQIFRPMANHYHGHYPSDSIAIIGVSCRFSGSETAHQFWDMIQARRTDNSPLEETTGAFDSAFFGKSSREAEYMDPQQRLSLHLAYQALESGGYFVPSSSATDDVGCYIGISSCDYEDNVNSRPPTAFSFTGTARAFASGRISHFFGLTGPSMVIDTACSSSAVAIHTACQAILSGECTMALAGGVNLMTAEARSHQNLAAACFLGPTGQCRSFDANADGYSRAEGGGFVLLKRLSSAVSDNDRILGVLAASAINNNKGNRSITVPSSESQTHLYRRVLEKASMHPRQVSYVEAHGTGTQKGDPVECQSIRNVFGGSIRPKLSPIRFGSVKGNLGHLEAASGLAGVIKVIMMLQHGVIPPQANFSVLNPSIPPLRDANMDIPNHLEPWKEPFRAALVNNYGASGTNAAILVCQPPPAPLQVKKVIDGKPRQYPIIVAAHTTASLHRYCRALLQFIETQHCHDAHTDAFFASLAFCLAQRQNQSLRQRILFSATSTDELKMSLYSHLNKDEKHDEAHVVNKPRTNNTKPVVLIFAGQTGRKVRLSREAYLSSSLLRRHLDRCDRTLQTLGLHSLFPRIFDPAPIHDLVDLHCIIFSLQYSVAVSWIDAGLQVKTVVGHSLGQLTALCVNGVLSLPDALKMVSGRALLIQNNWGPEQGCMLSVEADATTVQTIIAQMAATEYKVEIACYNSSLHHVVAGTEAAITNFEKAALLSKIPVKRLAVTHGFHSEMTNSIMPEYQKLLQELVLHPPSIPIEPCSKSGDSWVSLTSELIMRQSREPVYFAEAISRVEKRLGPCVWLEAGSGSTGVTMARRALSNIAGQNLSLSHSFYSVRLGDNQDPVRSLADTTLGLWSEGIRVQFWLYHALQRRCFQPLELPPYQFEKTEHWLSVIPRQMESENKAKMQKPGTREQPPKLVSLVGKQMDHRSDELRFEFSINQSSEEYSVMVQGRTVFGQILAPTSVYIESAARAYSLLPTSTPELSTSGAHSASLEVKQVKIHAPHGLDHQRHLRLTLQKQATGSNWNFVVESHPITDHEAKALKLQASGVIRPRNQKDGSSYLGSHRPLLRRLYDRCENLHSYRSASVVQGAFVKNALAPTAKYSESYFGIRSITSKDLEAVGEVVMPTIACRWHAETVFSPMTFDNFLLVAELHASSLGELADDHIYICNGFDAIIPHNHSLNPTSNPEEDEGPWKVISSLDRKNKTLVGDIFVFNATSKSLYMAILGASLRQIPARSLQTALEAMNSTSHVKSKAAAANNWEPEISIDTLNNLSDPIIAIHDAASLSDLEANMSLGSRHDNGSISEVSQEAESGIGRRGFGSVPSLFTPSSTNYTKGSPGASSDQALSSAGSSTPNDDHLALLGLLADHLDCSQEISSDTQLGTIGLDSLVAIQLQSDLEKMFGKGLNVKIDENSTLSDLSTMILQKDSTRLVESSMFTKTTVRGGSNSNELDENVYGSTQVTPVMRSPSSIQRSPSKFLAQATRQFGRAKEKTTSLTQEAGFSGFFSGVYQKQMSLVLAYILEAFSALGCDIRTLRAGDPLPPLVHQPRYKLLVSRFYEILDEAGFISFLDGQPYRCRTSEPLPPARSSADVYCEILTECFRYGPEHRLLNVTGPRLADCLSGRINPLQLLFQDEASIKLLEDVYVSSPMFATGNKMLIGFLGQVFSNLQPCESNNEKLRIVEIGAGTGATTRQVLDVLLAYNVKCTYAFTDVSVALVNSAKQKFCAHYGKYAPQLTMEFTVLDVEKPPPEGMSLSYDLIISSNCIHATRDLRQSCMNLEKLLLRDGGMLCLVELTRPLAWLDCVFGLLDGWWRFDDDRTYALAEGDRWKAVLLEAGFCDVDWTNDGSRESQQIRLITAWR